MSISDEPRTVDLVRNQAVDRSDQHPCDHDPSEEDQPTMLRADIAPAAVAILIVIGVLGLAAVAVSALTAAMIGFLTG